MMNLIELVHWCLQCSWFIDALGAIVLTLAWWRIDFVQPIHNEISGFELSTLHGGKQDLLLRCCSAGLPLRPKTGCLKCKEKRLFGSCWENRTLSKSEM